MKMLFLEQISNIIYKSDTNRYYLQEGLLFENPNQAIKFLKEKNLDPTTSPEGKKILDSITNITKGDGYTFLLTKFHLIDKLPLTDISKLHEYLKANKEHVNRLPKPVVTYQTYRELRQDLDDMESMRALKKLYNELPANLKQQQQQLPIQQQQNLKELAKKFNVLTSEQQNFFIKKVSGYKDINSFIDNLYNYINAIENSEDFMTIKKKIETTSNAYIVYDNPEQNIIIAHVNSFDASKILGCTSNWCITRDSQYWRSYKRGGNKYFFIWDFNYPAENINHLIGTAYNVKNPSKSKTHLKDDKSANLNDIIKSKNLNYDIFNNYIKAFEEKLTQEYQSSSGLINALKNFNDDADPLLAIIKNSKIVLEYGDPEYVYIIDDNEINLSLDSEDMRNVLDLGEEFDYINSIAYNYNYYDDYDSDELNYMNRSLNNDNIELLIEIAKKLKVPKKIYENFKKENELIQNFLEKYGLTNISDAYLVEYSDAQSNAKQNAANDLINEIPFDVDDGKFKPSKLLNYIVENGLTADNFDLLIEQIKDNLPDFSYDSLEYGIVDYDELNRVIYNKLKNVLIDLNDKNSDYYQKGFFNVIVDEELKKLGFEINDNGKSFKIMKNLEIEVIDNEYGENDQIYVTLKLDYNESYYKERNKKIPQSRTVKIPLEKLKNYINQYEIIYENFIKKLIKEELERMLN